MVMQITRSAFETDLQPFFVPLLAWRKGGKVKMTPIKICIIPKGEVRSPQPRQNVGATRGRTQRGDCGGLITANDPAIIIIIF